MADFLEAYEKSLGVVTPAAKAAGIHRATVYRWRADYPEFDEACKEIEGVALDFVETKMFDTISKGTAQDYERLLGEKVIIYYRDQRGTDRKLVGRLTDIDGDKLWRGCINCAVCAIGVVSTVQGWSGREDALS